MRQIIKHSAPGSLTAHKKKPLASYDNYRQKEDVRKSTHAEQRGICCYCMGPIIDKIHSMKIEHFKCQDVYPLLDLEYNNMLGACMGNEGQPERLQHCDTFKGNKELHFAPQNRGHAIQDLISYDNDGTIRSANAGLNDELKTVLNLNVLHMKARRKAVLDGFKDSLHRYNGTPKRQIIERWIADWNGDSQPGALRPYCQVVVYWLQKKLNSSWA